MITALCLLLSAAMAATPPPQSDLVAKMILTEVVQNGESNRASGIQFHGQCKRFQWDTFAEVSPDFMLAAYPDAELTMPLNYSTDRATSRPEGAMWEALDPSEGNAYIEVARFDNDPSKTKKENAEVALSFLRNVRAGDQLQILGRYSSGGRGNHSLMFTRPYDPRSEYLYWADSNFSNKRIDGVLYGNVRAFQQWKVEEVIGWLTADGNNAATLYRLNGDIVRRPE